MMTVVAIGGEIARPFAFNACKRYELPYDPESGDGLLWWAGIERGSVRAALAWSPIDDETLAIFGPFGDGSSCEESWMVDLLRAMQCIDVAWIVIPASPSLYIRRQSARLESYGARRAFVVA